MKVEVAAIRQTVEIQERTVVLPVPRVRIVTVGVQGPPGPPGAAVSFVTEVPAGAVNGANAVFTLSAAPTFLLLVHNGLVQKGGTGNDFTVSGNTVTFAVAPEPGASLLAHFLT